MPTLLTWPHSALIHDFKGENWGADRGRAQAMGQLCLKFDPTEPEPGAHASTRSPRCGCARRTRSATCKTSCGCWSIRTARGCRITGIAPARGVEASSCQLYEGRDPTLAACEARLSIRRKPQRNDGATHVRRA